MTLEGLIEDGQVILDTPVVLPDGTKVTVSVQTTENQPAEGEEFPTLYDRLKPVIGKAKGLPSDLAINHDRYLHKFDTWVRGLPSHNPDFDDSRESMYPDRS